jgi:hypothetical protein
MLARALGNQRDHRVTRADGGVEHPGQNAAAIGVANADHLLGPENACWTPVNVATDAAIPTSFARIGPAGREVTRQGPSHAAWPKTTTDSFADPDRWVDAKETMTRTGSMAETRRTWLVRRRGRCPRRPRVRLVHRDDDRLLGAQRLLRNRKGCTGWRFGSAPRARHPAGDLRSCGSAVPCCRTMEPLSYSLVSAVPRPNEARQYAQIRFFEGATSLSGSATPLVAGAVFHDGEGRL